MNSLSFKIFQFLAQKLMVIQPKLMAHF